MPKPHSEPCVDFQDSSLKQRTVLSKEVLQEVWADMANTTLPSWIQMPPKNVGSSSAGRLKADQWRTFSTVNLVITLIRLWSGTDMQPMLDNFLALVSAVRWATLRSTSNNHISVVQEQMIHYLTTTVQLFGARVLTINHHMSLHIVDFLRLFGPVHGWWSFPFERYNGILAGTNSNFKAGESS